MRSSYCSSTFALPISHPDGCPRPTKSSRPPRPASPGFRPGTASPSRSRIRTNSPLDSSYVLGPELVAAGRESCLRVVPGRDALSLPVSKHGAPRDAQRCGYLVVGLVAGRQPAHLPPTTRDVVGGVARVRLAQSHRSRSEAHTSELQSLMRTSYAV